MTNNDEALKELAARNDANRKKVSSPVRVDRTDTVKLSTAKELHELHLAELKGSK